MTDTVLAICGALRSGSFNRKLLAQAFAAYGEAEAVHADLRLPLYDGDLETRDGIPPAVQTLSDQIRDASAIIIASPEYNKSVSGVLKNALDWVSRTKGPVWPGKPVAILSANDGREGGARGQYALRLCLTPFRADVLQGPEVCVADCSHAFDADGRLLDVRYQKALADLMATLRGKARR